MTEKLNVSRYDGPDDYPARRRVANAQVGWEVTDDSYQPPYYVSEEVLTSPAADPERMDFAQQRFESVVDFTRDAVGRPLNPFGRTGIAGRGKLYRWGANQTADAIVTRGIGSDLEVVLGRRADNHRLALPGGFLDRDEPSAHAALRELWEETRLDIRGQDPRVVMRLIGRVPVKKSIRMTDNAWIETSFYHVDAVAAGVSDVEPVASDDLEWAAWVPVADIRLSELHDDHAQYLVSCLAKTGLYNISLLRN